MVVTQDRRCCVTLRRLVTVIALMSFFPRVQWSAPCLCYNTVLHTAPPSLKVKDLKIKCHFILFIFVISCFKLFIKYLFFCATWLWATCHYLSTQQDNLWCRISCLLSNFLWSVLYGYMGGMRTCDCWSVGTAACFFLFFFYDWKWRGWTYEHVVSRPQQCGIGQSLNYKQDVPKLPWDKGWLSKHMHIC